MESTLEKLHTEDDLSISQASISRSEPDWRQQLFIE